MCSCNISFTFLISILSLVSTSWMANFPVTYQGSQVLAQTLENRKAEADRFYQQGKEQTETNPQSQAALQSFQKALVIYQEIGDIKGEGLTLNYIAIVQKRLGEYRQALDLYQQALVIFRKLGDRLNEGTVLNNIGAIYQDEGQYAEALKFYEQALSIRQEVNDYLGAGVTLNELGILYDTLGQYQEAIKANQQALDIFRQISEKKREALTLNAIGLFYRNLGKYTEALKFYQQGLNIFKELEDPLGQATLLNNLGDIELNQNHYSQSQDFFEQALKIFQKVEFRVGEGVALSNLGRVDNAIGNYLQAQEFYRQALSIFREVGQRGGEGRTLKYIGSTFYETGKLEEAENNLQNAIEVLDSLRSKLSDTNKVSVFETQAEAYRLLQQVLIAQNKTNEALEISERGRARAFVELLASRLSEKPDNQLVINSPKIAEIQQIAKLQNATLVEYSIGEAIVQVEGKKEAHPVINIWVVQSTGKVAFKQVNIQFLKQQNLSLKDLVTTTRELMAVRGIFDVEIINTVDEKSQAKNLQHLYRILIDPIANLLPTDSNQHIIFVPQGELFLVPFAALQDEKGKYLIENHTILTSPSIQVLKLTRQQRKKVKQTDISEVLVIGNPTMPSVAQNIGDQLQPLPNLPGAKREAEAIATFFNTQSLTGNKATKSAVLAKIPQSRFVHLATHGLFDDFQGLQSAIALAPTQTDKGLLTAEEIFDLKLNAELIVLSACNTGRGRITGDGVIGLSRSLISAGVPSVIVSLWSVPDAATTELMIEFYRQLEQTGDKAQSLRHAMLKLQKQYPNSPKKWAAFTLIGEAE